MAYVRPEHTDVLENDGITTERLSDAGGLTQFGAHRQTLAPGAASSDRHWHEREDEMVVVLSGKPTLVEDAETRTLEPGDVVVWKGGVPNAHHLVNRSDVPCTFLVIGARVGPDVCHYPDSGQTLVTEESTWRLLDRHGRVLKRGTLLPFIVRASEPIP